LITGMATFSLYFLVSWFLKAKRKLKPLSHVSLSYMVRAHT